MATNHRVLDTAIGKATIWGQGERACLWGDLGEVAASCLFSGFWNDFEMGMILSSGEEHAPLKVNRIVHDLLEAYPQMESEIDAILSHEGDLGNAHTLFVDDRIFGYSRYRVGAYICILLRDITEKKRLEALAHSANLMETIGIVFSGIRHELGNPLNVIKLSVDLLNQNLDSMTKEDIAVYLKRMSDEVSRVEFLLRCLRSYSAYDVIDLAELDLRQFFRTFQSIASEGASKYDVDLQISIDEAVQTVPADPRALHHVLLNLFANSLDAVRDVDDPRIKIEASLQGDELIIQVQDNGSGIADDALGDVFKPFHTSKAHGQGLGLVVAKNMMTSMGGGISIRSRKGVGTIVKLTLQRPGQAL